MIKISKVEAYQSFNETDFSVMEDELYLCASSDQRGDREQKQQFFLLDETTIILEIYWNDEKVRTVAFENKAELTEQGKKRLKEQIKNAAIKDREGNEVEKVRSTTKHLAFETNHKAYELSAGMIDLEVIQGAVAKLMEKIDDITYKKWDEDPSLARLSIGEIKDTVRLIDMAFYPLFSTLNENVEKLDTYSNELLDIIVNQGELDAKKA